MKNREIVSAINNVNEFAKAEREAKIAKLPIAAESVVMENLSTLQNAYVPYLMTLETIKSRYGEEDLNNQKMSSQFNKEVNELLDTDRPDVVVKKIKKSSFKEGTMLSDMMLLDFMIE